METAADTSRRVAASGAAALEPPRTERRGPAPALVEAALGSALAAHRGGTLEVWLRRHRGLQRWASPLLRPVVGAMGDAGGEGSAAASAAVLLRWLITELRPDRQDAGAEIDRQAWLDRTSWRPMLAVWCHFGFGAVPDFRDRYRRRADESSADNLCGLWSVGPSTFYRYLDKGRQALAQRIVPAQHEGSASLALRALATQEAYRRLKLVDETASVEWHRQQAGGAAERRDPRTALWHLLLAGDAAEFIRTLRRACIELAPEVETDLLVDRLAAQPLPTRHRFDLCLAQAALWRTRDADVRERECLEQGLRIASAAADALLLGIGYGALGKFYEARDIDRALACYEDSADLLRQVTAPSASAPSPEAVDESIRTLARLAWLHVQRNDPRARTLLDKAQQLRAQPDVPLETMALLEQVWGEYWRRAGDLKLALQHKHRALNLYERLADQPMLLSTYNNLSLLYGEAKDFARAADYAGQVLAMAERMPVDPYIVTGTHLNLGANLFWQGRYGEAIEQYRLGLRKSELAGMRVHIGRAHYNLAEAYYKRFQIDADADDERQGDQHAAAAHKVWASENDSAARDATLNLKNEILGARDGVVYDRLLPEEFAAHFTDLANVQRERSVLALPAAPEVHVRAHLAIAKAYLAISAKEREAALALIHKHGLGESFASEFDDLRSTFDRELTREQQVAALWQKAAGELLQEERRIAVLEHLFRDGSIQKSVYARLCGLGLATASKHLVTLAERGLLTQTGKGPSTRYTLPA